MKIEKMVQHLTDSARKMGFQVRTEEGNFHGGQCWFADQRLIILNRRMSMEERADLIARVLVAEDLDTIYLVPEVRHYIEKSTPVDRSETED